MTAFCENQLANMEFTVKSIIYFIATYFITYYYIFIIVLYILLLLYVMHLLCQ